MPAHGGHGFDDIVVIVASVPAIEAAMPHLAPDGLLVVFGGLARGTPAMLDFSPIYLGGAQITGSAGATIRDQSNVLAKVAAGNLTTASAVAAIGGLDAARDGMQGLMDGRFPGKMVIFPQVEAFPLTALADLKTAAPIGLRLAGRRRRLDARGGGGVSAAVRAGGVCMKEAIVFGAGQHRPRLHRPAIQRIRLRRHASWMWISRCSMRSTGAAEYTIRLVTNEQSEEVTVGPVRGGARRRRGRRRRGGEPRVEIGATAVGAGALKHVAPAIAAGIERRAQAGVS